MLLAAATLLLAAAANPFPQVTAMSLDETVDALRQCGLHLVTVSHDADVGEDLIALGDVEADDAQLECAAQVSLDSGYWVEVAAPLREHYLELSARLSRDRAQSDARALLAAQGKLDRVPEYIPGETDDADIMRQLKALCSEEASHAPPQVGQRQGSAPAEDAAPPEEIIRESDATICLITYAAAAGVWLGIIGKSSAPAR